MVIHLLLGLSVGASAVGGYLFLPQSLLSIDNRIRDFLFLFRGEKPTSGATVIVNIDEKSLLLLGQWPWERHKVAQTLSNLAEAGAGVIGLDVVFAEYDNSSPKRVLTNMGLVKEANSAPDYDEILGNTVASTPTIAGYIFIMEKDDIAPGESPFLNGIFIERGGGENDLTLHPYRPVLNIPPIQDKAYSSGYFNVLPDDDSGIIRSVPLVMKYEGSIYPSLSLEMIRIALNQRRVIVSCDPNIGVEKIVIGNLEIPTDRHGRLFVNFRGAEKTFDYISAVDVFNNNFDPKRVADKFVLIGSSAMGLLDLRSMPFDNAYPGVEIHASVIDNILMGDFISRPSWAIAVDAAMILFAAVFLSVILAYAPALIAFATIILYSFGYLALNYWALFSQGLILNLFVVLMTIIVTALLALAVNYFLETRQKEIIWRKLAKKVSINVVKDLLKSSDLNVLEGHEREITIFFSDIRNFTHIAEEMKDPKALIGFLNDYMTPMTDIIMGLEGTVDKFIGDSIMAYWNAPNAVKNHQDKALTAALRQIEALAALNERLVTENKPPIGIGIGLNTGTATVGEMGSKGRADYTVIGDTVNLASRLEGLTKVYFSGIVISDSVKTGLTGEYILRELDRVRVKGRREHTTIYEVIDFGKPNEELALELKAHNEALSLYREESFSSAFEAFKELDYRKSRPIYKVFIDRCKYFMTNPPEDFDGVFTYLTK